MNKLLALLLVALLAASCRAPTPVTIEKPVPTFFHEALVLGPDSTLVCLGDSLTAGGNPATPTEQTYPAYLQQFVSIPVVNAGVSGDTTAGALARLQTDVLAHDPAIVIVELGVNDYRYAGDDFDIAQTERNLRQILSALDDGNRVTCLVKFYNPDFARAEWGARTRFYEEFEAMYDRLVSDYDVLLIEDIWAGIWGNPALMADDTHPNGQGYRIMADNYLRYLGPVLQQNGIFQRP